MATVEVTKSWQFPREITGAPPSGSDADWVATNDVAGAKAAGVANFDGKGNDVFLELVALAGNAVVSPFAGTANIEILELAKAGGQGGEQLVSHGAAVALAVGDVLKVPSVGRGSFVFRLDTIASLGGSVTRLLVGVRAG